MNTPRLQLILPVLGLAAFAFTPNPAFAQQDKGSVESTQGVTTGQVDGSAEKIDTPKVDQKGGKNSGKKGGAGKATAQQRQLMHDLTAEMGRYRANRAKLEQVREVATKNNNQELLDKANEMEPKLEAKHQSAMDALRAKYGDKEVSQAIEILNSKDRSDVKANKKYAEGAKKKGRKQSKEVKGKGKQKRTHKKSKDGDAKKSQGDDDEHHGDDEDDDHEDGDHDDSL